MCLVGVVVMRYIDFLILLIPTPYVYICSFLQNDPYFLLNFFVFRSCSSIFLNFILKIFSRNINKHKGDYRRPTETV